MRKIMVIFTYLLSFFVINSVFAQGKINSDSHSEKQVKSGPEYFFIEVARGGVLQKNKLAEGYTLKLYGADEWVAYFTGLPHRVAGVMPRDNLKKMFDKATTEYPKGLNAGLVAINAKNNKKIIYAISIKSQNYDNKMHILTFNAYIIPGEQKNTLPENIALNHVTLFIDPCTSCGGPP